jgi:hypothetical protein
MIPTTKPRYDSLQVWAVTLTDRARIDLLRYEDVPVM